MKLSSREKTLLVLLGIFVIAVGVYYLAVEPIHMAYDMANEEYLQIESQYRMVKNDVKDDSEMEAIIGDYRDRLTYLETKLPHQIYLEKIINDMYNHFESYDLVVDTITFNLIESETEDQVVTENNDGSLGVENLRPAPSIEEILASYEADENITETTLVNGEITTIDYSKIGYMNVNMSFTSNYDVFKDALSTLVLMDSTVIPTNVNISKNEYDPEDSNADDNEVFVALTIGIPFFYDNEPLEDIFFDYEFEPNGDFEEHGPFEYVAINNDEVETNTGGTYRPSTVQSSSSDFIIAIRNTVSDLAAQSFAYTNISASRLELDSNRNERYILDINESGSTLSFKYSNDNAVYPTAGSELLSPKGDDIVIKVDSSARSNADDNAGLTLVLNNRSSRKVMIYVSNDDVNNPRFNIIVNSGAFEVIRN